MLSEAPYRTEQTEASRSGERRALDEMVAEGARLAKTAQAYERRAQKKGLDV